MVKYNLMGKATKQNALLLVFIINFFKLRGT